MAARAGGEQHRREKAADGAGRGQGAGLLEHGEQAGQPHQGGEQRERQGHGQELVKPGRGEHHQVEDADAAALQSQAVESMPPPQQPAGAKQRQAPRGHGRQAQFERDQLALGRVLEQEGHPEEQDHQAGLEHRVAAGEEADDGCEQVGEPPARRRGFCWRPGAGFGRGRGQGHGCRRCWRDRRWRSRRGGRGRVRPGRFGPFRLQPGHPAAQLLHTQGQVGDQAGEQAEEQTARLRAQPGQKGETRHQDGQHGTHGSRVQALWRITPQWEGISSRYCRSVTSTVHSGSASRLVQAPSSGNCSSSQ